MSYSNPSYRGVDSDRFHKEIWSLVLPYLLNHLEDRPFNLAYSSYVYLWQQTGTHPAKLNEINIQYEI